MGKAVPDSRGNMREIVYRLKMNKGYYIFFLPLAGFSGLYIASLLLNDLKFNTPKEEKMKKALMIALTVLISAAFVTAVFAQAPAEKTTTTTTTTTPEKKETTTKVTKSKAMMFTGEVTNMDMAAKMMTAKGKKGDMTFDVSGAKMKGEAKAGDKVTVKYTEKDGKMMASSVTMGGAKTTKKTTVKTTEKKEETTAPAK
jgi:hypothetical protein